MYFVDVQVDPVRLLLDGAIELFVTRLIKSEPRDRDLPRGGYTRTACGRLPMVSHKIFPIEKTILDKEKQSSRHEQSASTHMIF